MSILDRAIKRGVNKAVNRAVSSAVERAVAPAIDNAVNKAADSINQQVGQPYQGQPYQGQPYQNNSYQGQSYQPQPNQNVQNAAATLGGAFGSLTSAMQGIANEAAKNMKMCPSCGEPAGADKKFCPSCGAKLPEQTVAQGAVCSSCGAQNDVGMKFCASCGTKLPSAIAEENAARAKDEAQLAKWGQLLPQYPVWSLGGHDIDIEEGSPDDMGRPTYILYVRGVTPSMLAQYKQLLMQSGFRPAGKYPSNDMLYRRVGAGCYFFEAYEPFRGDRDCLSVSFGQGEPEGGFDYVKPEPKKPASLRDLFNL